MSKPLRNNFLIVFCLLPGTSCQNGDPTGPYVGADTAGSIRVDFTTQPGRWHADQLVIDSASIASDVLHVHVHHGGGCARHAYAAVAYNGWLESNPVQVGAFLAHNANRDPCDALLNAHLRFDLVPLRDAYRKSYGPAAAELVIQLAEAFPWNHGPVTLRYRF
ncbi:MAG: hypothetical protein ACRENP_14895 [Longimicrobiales bacterium]